MGRGEPEFYESPAQVAGDLNVSLLGTLARIEPEIEPPFTVTDLVDPGVSYEAIIGRVELLCEHMPLKLLGCLGLDQDPARFKLAANLAARLARTGRQVTIVEAELRAPAFAGDPARREGLIDMLLYGCSYGAVVRESGLLGVKVITAGSHPWSGEPIHGDEWERVLGALRKHSDLTIVTTTTGLPGPILSMLARRLDSILIAYALDVAGRDAVRRSYLTLWDMDAPILGLVTAGPLTAERMVQPTVPEPASPVVPAPAAAPADAAWAQRFFDAGPAESVPGFDLDDGAEVVIRETTEVDESAASLWAAEVARLRGTGAPPIGVSPFLSEPRPAPVAPPEIPPAPRPVEDAGELAAAGAGPKADDFTRSFEAAWDRLTRGGPGYGAAEAPPPAAPAGPADESGATGEWTPGVELPEPEAPAAEVLGPVELAAASEVPAAAASELPAADVPEVPATAAPTPAMPEGFEIEPAPPGAIEFEPVTPQAIELEPVTPQTIELEPVTPQTPELEPMVPQALAPEPWPRGVESELTPPAPPAPEAAAFEFESLVPEPPAAPAAWAAEIEPTPAVAAEPPLPAPPAVAAPVATEADFHEAARESAAEGGGPLFADLLAPAGATADDRAVPDAVAELEAELAPRPEPPALRRSSWRLIVVGGLVGICLVLAWAYQSEVIRFGPPPPRTAAVEKTAPGEPRRTESEAIPAPGGDDGGTRGPAAKAPAVMAPAPSSPAEPAPRAMEPPAATRVEPSAGEPSPSAAPRAAPAPAPPAAVAGTSPRVPDSAVHAGPGTGPYGVHVSSFRTRAKAEEDLSRYRALGFACVIVSADVPGKGSWLRVLLGPYPSLEEATRVMEMVRADQLSPAAQVLTIPR
jgi:hypothetical protein